ncbi:phosphonate ABC transporter, permease protein PhnE [Paenibacillus glycinis]|uniref:Phosphonate ABC transporter, permease protein PhnE n=1 Tax=Paenibacillus glycinis TaxID=2697035 RepID=A0ABW9XMA4_9BACL|nr:phosphonate ABC transporter, permease protein PhnE [Paenibacillus glycinis]NBD23673.1 phosphonate ABC transporter, permease protein PhnE [Paenibacillus glycinis]
MSSEYVTGPKLLNREERLSTGSSGEPARKRRDPVLTGAAAFGAVFFVFCLVKMNFDYSLLAHGTGKLITMFGDMFPPNAAEWRYVLKAALESLEIAVVGTAIAVVLAFFLSFAAASNVSPRTAWAIKGLASLIRAIPTLVWALLYIVAVGMGPLPGILAIGTHAVGMLVKMFAQSIEEVNPGVIEALEATGAGKLQVIAQGILPNVVRPFVAWSVFRLEIDIGESTILGAVGAGGIGFEIANAMRMYEFDKVIFAALVIFAMVFSVEWLSNRMKLNVK